MTRLANRKEIRELQGTRAGIVSRGLADAVDLVAVVVIAFLILLVATAVRALFSRSLEFVSVPQPGRGILAAVLLVAYLGYGWGLEGRTLGKTLMGLRVVGDDGADISPARGVLRALLYLVFPPGFLWSAVSGRNASLQDLAVRTSVVHDWGFAAGTGGITPPATPPGPARSASAGRRG